MLIIIDTGIKLHEYTLVLCGFVYRAIYGQHNHIIYSLCINASKIAKLFFYYENLYLKKVAWPGRRMYICISYKYKYKHACFSI